VLEPIDKAVVYVEGRTIAAEDGVLPLGCPLPVRQAGELLDLHIPFGLLEDAADRVEKTGDTMMLAGSRQRPTNMKHEVVAEHFVERRSIGLENGFGHAVDHGDVGMRTHGYLLDAMRS